MKLGDLNSSDGTRRIHLTSVMTGGKLTLKQKVSATAPRRGPSAGRAEGSAPEDVVDIFSKFDTRGDGVIAEQELGEVLKAIDQERWNDESVGVLLKRSSSNQNGQVDYEDFVMGEP
eukprot:TRINITY_DN18999_c0_g1_i1.p1 TRINITY_DN18999_c0_g1~~TRINITY_DN18999_c0_g1_i1.p1  ORF type:complete len:117 (-),score=30.82 TRINITY_DN18999_c0_g1_i1:23-373(-)